MNGCFGERKWGFVSLKSWRKVNIARYDAPCEQTEHAVINVVFCDWGWVREGVISEVLREDALRLANLLLLAHANAQLFKLNVADATLCAPILEVIRFWQTKLFSDKVVSVRIFWITRQKGVLLFGNYTAHRLAQLIQFLLDGQPGQLREIAGFFGLFCGFHPQALLRSLVIQRLLNFVNMVLKSGQR